MKIHKPKSIKEAIYSLQEFLECDLYTKFRPIEKIKGKEWCRKDYFKNEEEFIKYLENHFELLRKQIKSNQIKSNQTSIYLNKGI